MGLLVEEPIDQVLLFVAAPPRLNVPPKHHAQPVWLASSRRVSPPWLLLGVPRPNLRGNCFLVRYLYMTLPIRHSNWNSSQKPLRRPRYSGRYHRMSSQHFWKSIPSTICSQRMFPWHQQHSRKSLTSYFLAGITIIWGRKVHTQSFKDGEQGKYFVALILTLFYRRCLKYCTKWTIRWGRCPFN